MKSSIHIMVLLLLVVIAPIEAATTHFMGFSIAGGEANTISSTLQTKAGADADLEFIYSSVINHFFFEVGIGADYQWLNLGKTSQIDSRNATDLAGEDYIYQYRYSNIKEQHRNINAQLRLMVGGLIKDYVYLSGGLRVRYSVSPQVSTTADMYTCGVYDQYAAECITNRPQYGFYPSDIYTSTNRPARFNVTLAPTFEAGAQIPMNVTSLLRVGAYIDCAFPLSAGTGMITDLTNVDLNPKTQNSEDLKQNLLIRSVMDSESVPFVGALEVGIRLTFLFKLYKSHYPCRCFPN